MDRKAVVFVVAALLAALVSIVRPQAREANRVVTADVSYATRTSFNAAAFGVVAILVALYVAWW